MPRSAQNAHPSGLFSDVGREMGDYQGAPYQDPELSVVWETVAIGRMEAMSEAVLFPSRCQRN